ncbi:serine/threonine-protein kinase MARK2-like [Myotis yumanensis]|uniref:serine/threonine-protein kinase MARK2-like n=1 Tax=Myotis yumanensis TaxID=159337 RepID=UPI0038D1AAF3
MCDFFEDTSVKVEWLCGNYAILDNIGRGSFGEVRLARHLLTNRKVAVKIVNCEDPADMAEEIYCLKELNHPNIIKLFEVVNTNNQVYMFMEYAYSGTLYQHLKRWGPLSEEAARAPFRQLLSAVHYCHQKHIVHRDIKPENLLDMGLNIKLADFGLSAVFMDEKLTFCGTPNYKAPELFRLELYEGPKVDVWTPPLKNLSFSRAGRGKQKQPTTLKTMINIDPGRSPTLRVIIQDVWVNTGEAEEMTPYIEPSSTNLDPRVEVKRIVVQKGSEHLENTSQAASAHLENISQTAASAHLENISQAASTHLENISQSASAHLENISQAASAHSENTSQAASAHLENISQAAKQQQPQKL